MSRKKKIIISVSIIGLFLISLAISYAYFSAVIYNNESTSTIVGTAAYLELTFEDGSPEISASDIIPGWSATKTFKVKNTGEKTAYYKLKIKDISNPFVDGGLSFEIRSNDGGETIEKRLVLTRTRDISLPIEIGVNEEHNYSITTYYNNIDADQSADVGKTFKFTIGIESVRELMGKPLHWDNPGENTLLAAIKENYPKAVAPETIPGQEINVEEEALLSAAIDDYGTSYYYRGNVQNNYVVFANKCWKIVRITGNGNIKLILWNNNGIGCSTNAAPTSAFNSGKYIRDIDGVETDVDITASGVGFMYGKPDSRKVFTDNNTGAQDNITDSTILTNLKTWYKTTFGVSDSNLISNYTNLLADVIWCGDKSFYSGPGYGQIIDTEILNTFFRANRRVNENPKSPILVCPNAGLDGKASKYTALDTEKGNGALNGYKAGLITVDEVAYAGGIVGMNTNYYLYTNSYYWTMSPQSFIVDSVAYVWVFNAFGGFNGGNSSAKVGLRPLIALNYNVQATYSTSSQYAPGTVNNPYVITV